MITTVMKEFVYKLVEDAGELKDALEVRKQVFVAEQGILENIVFDDNESGAMHMVVKDGEKVIGTARVRFPEAKQAKLERMAVLKPFRCRGVGQGIVSFLVRELKNKQIEKIVLHAQHGVVGFYQSCGFSALGVPFEEADIEHLKMGKKL